LSDLPEAGFKFRAHALCSGCKKRIEFWSPPQSAPPIAYDVMLDGTSPVKEHRCGRSSREPTAASLRRQAAQW